MRLRLLSPGDPTQRTGGYLYNARMMAALRAMGRDAQTLVVDWPGGRAPLDTYVTPYNGRQCLVVDGLMWTSLGDQRRVLTDLGRVVVLCHSPLYREAKSLSEASRLRAEEELALMDAHGVIVTGKPTASSLHIEVPCALVEPGVEPREATQSPAADPPVALTVATLTRRKGHAVLAHALARMPMLNWWCAGNMDREPAVRDELVQLVSDLGMQDRVRFLGELDEARLAHVMSQATFLLQGAHFEAYGMGLAEGLAAGLPVVSPPAGALSGLQGHPAWQPFAAGDVHDAERALYRMLGQLESATTAAAALRFPSWDDQAQRLWGFLETV